MIALISPAKTLDFETKSKIKKFTIPDHLDRSEVLIKKLRTYSSKKISTLMDLSENLANLNVQRYKDWNADFNLNNSKQAIMAFKGDVYLGIQAESFTAKELNFAQEHLLILSGLHGYLRPLDLLKPYRLEMGSQVSIAKSKNLYAFWSEQVASYLNSELANHKEKTIINIASEEYFKVVNKKLLEYPIVNIEFKERKGLVYKSIGFFAKKARGYMAAYAIKNRVEKSSELKNFNQFGYSFNTKLSNDNNWIFTREEPS